MSAHIVGQINISHHRGEVRCLAPAAALAEAAEMAAAAWRSVLRHSANIRQAAPTGCLGSQFVAGLRAAALP